MKDYIEQIRGEEYRVSFDEFGYSLKLWQFDKKDKTWKIVDEQHLEDYIHQRVGRAEIDGLLLKEKV